MRAGHVALVVLSAACARRPPTTASSTVVDWVAPTSFTYATVEHLSDGTVAELTVSEAWVPRAVCTPRDRCFDVTSAVMGADGYLDVSSEVYVLGASGYGWTATTADGTTTALKLVLPPSPEPGATWTGHFELLSGPSQRTCRVDRDTTFCAAGLATTCRTTRSSMEILIRSHFCPGDGWRGEEYGVYGVAAGFVGRSYRVVRAGQVLPDPADELRPIPVVADIAHVEP